MMKRRTIKKAIGTQENSKNTAQTDKKYSSMKSLQTLTEAFYYSENLISNTDDVELQLICEQLYQKSSKSANIPHEKIVHNCDENSEKSVDSELSYIKTYAAVDNLLYAVPSEPDSADDIVSYDNIDLGVGDNSKASSFGKINANKLQNDNTAQAEQEECHIDQETYELAHYLMKNKWLVFTKLAKFCSTESLLQFMQREGYNYDKLPQKNDKEKSEGELKFEEKSSHSLKQQLLKCAEDGSRQIIAYMLTTGVFQWILYTYCQQWTDAEVAHRLRLATSYPNNVKRQLISIISCFNTMFCICTFLLNLALVLPLWKRKSWHLMIVYLNVFWCFYAEGSFLLTFLTAIYALYKTGTAWQLLALPTLLCIMLPLYHVKLSVNMLRIPFSSIKTKDNLKNT